MFDTATKSSSQLMFSGKLNAKVTSGLLGEVYLNNDCSLFSRKFQRIQSFFYMPVLTTQLE